MADEGADSEGMADADVDAGTAAASDSDKTADAEGDAEVALVARPSSTTRILSPSGNGGNTVSGAAGGIGMRSKVVQLPTSTSIFSTLCAARASRVACCPITTGLNQGN